MEYILSIYDTFSKKKKKIDLIERKNNPINIYVCGITPYDHTHIGHARCYVSYDILVRLIRYFGFKVTYIQNITDVNDKIFNKAVVLYNDITRYLEVANFYHLEFKSLLNKIGCLAPDYYPRVSESINEIIALIKKIINEGYAYETVDGVYFKANAFSGYGQLSQRDLARYNKNISRIDNLHEKNNDYDFVLWKKIDRVPCWMSPWGMGLPGWHIECSAMINKTFGECSLDIHGGGMDLLFPHHENEKAQSECCSDFSLTNIWMHVAFINNNKEKMSKSLGNSFLLKDIINQFNPMVFRLYLLMHHYASPIEFDLNGLNAIVDSYSNLVSIFHNDTNPEFNYKIDSYQSNFLNEIYQLLFDNLNTAAVIGLIFKNKKIIRSNYYLFSEIKKIVKYLLGLSLEIDNNIQQDNNKDKIEKLILERELARKSKNFIKADEIRKILLDLGINLNDKKL